MAFLKLFPRKDRNALSVSDVLRHLRDEFAFVDADPDAGQDHVSGMIAATCRFSDSVPGKQERLTWLISVQDSAVYVSFGDDVDLTASCCLMPGKELFFDSRDEIHGRARLLVERAASALGYELFEG